jgi:hypothetical protein
VTVPMGVERGVERGVAIGEIRTGLLRHSGSLARADVATLLALVPGEPVRQSERPIAHAVSPDIADGVDCALATGADGRGRVRAVGTLLTQAVVVGGRVVQSSSLAWVDPAGTQRRRDWAHYTAQPGVIETITKTDTGQISAGFLAGGENEDCLDPGAVCERLARRVQSSPLLDGKAPLRFQWTRLRWSARFGADPAGGPGSDARFVLVDDSMRTLSLGVPAARLDAVVELCRDMALHDWVLSTLTRRVERLYAPERDRERAVAWLRPVIDHLLHLWMPGARVADDLAAVWEGFERRPGFSRQWDTAVARVRDQVALHTLQLLGELSR